MGENESKELPELKILYDELWSDAKTLFRDMSRSISIYLYAGVLTVIVAVFAFTTAYSMFSALSSNTSNIFLWSFGIVEITCAVVAVAFGGLLLSWYRRLRKKYWKLIEMEENLRD